MATEMKDQSAYISYLPMLLKTIEASGDKPILELGMGFSTQVIHMLCKTSRRKIISYENDPKWYKENLVYETDWHWINFVEDWDRVDVKAKHWGVVLIDHRPANRRRVEALRVRDNADFVILHDTEPEIDRFYRYTGVYPHYKYVYHDKSVMPNTSVLSNFHNLDIKEK